jgi:hypothetical protein
MYTYYYTLTLCTTDPDYPQCVPWNVYYTFKVILSASCLQVKPTLVGDLESRGGDRPADIEPEKPPLSKRQKWRLKCRAKRLRRRERRKNSTLETTRDSGEEEEGGQAMRTKVDSAVLSRLPTDTKQQLPDNIDRRNRSRTRKATGIDSSGGGVRSRGVKVQRSADPHPGTVKMSGRKRKRKGVESSKEEAEFAEMVAKYRKKLQRTSL